MHPSRHKQLKCASKCRALRQSLPRAPPPEQQTVTEPDILYTTLARIVLPPAGTESGAAQPGAQAADQGHRQTEGSIRARALRAGGGSGSADEALRAAVDAMSGALCGLQVTLSELWCVPAINR